jgi:hypothetical protein
MLQNPNNQGKIYCKRCQTYYEKAHSNCPFCSQPSSKNIEQDSKKSGPTSTDLELFNLIKPLSDDQKLKLIKFIQHDINPA